MEYLDVVALTDIQLEQGAEFGAVLVIPTLVHNDWQVVNQLATTALANSVQMVGSEIVTPYAVDISGVEDSHYRYVNSSENLVTTRARVMFVEIQFGEVIGRDSKLDVDGAFPLIFLVLDDVRLGFRGFFLLPHLSSTLPVVRLLLGSQAVPSSL